MEAAAKLGVRFLPGVALLVGLGGCVLKVSGPSVDDGGPVNGGADSGVTDGGVADDSDANGSGPPIGGQDGGDADGSGSAPCMDITCGAHGTCVPDGQVATCACDPNYHASGLDCVSDESGHAIPGTIQAEDFDDGGEGVAYHDHEASNLLDGDYRPGEGVDIKTCSDISGGYAVGTTAAGEWINYTVDVGTSDIYTVEMRVAAASSGKALHLELDGEVLTGTLAVPVTGPWDTDWASVIANAVTLSPGRHVVRVVFDTGEIDLNYLTFTHGGDSPTCTDGVDNGDETDVDCGGSCAENCAVGDLCAVTSDCASENCVGGHCEAAPGCTPSTYDAEVNMTHSIGHADRGGWNISGNGYITTAGASPGNPAFDAGPATITVTAFGDIGGGSGPHMVVTVGGIEIGDTIVSATSWTDYTFTLTASASLQEVQVWFDNDYYEDGDDRNLLLQKVDIDCS